MKFAILASKKDLAGMNIVSFLKDIPIYYTEENIIYSEKVAGEIKEDFIIFASKHKGKKEKMLSLHAPGNWGRADLGGKPNIVCKTSSVILKVFFQELNKNIPDGWTATLECTHHGPYVEKPCLFIEIGSSEKEWPDKEAGNAIAETIKNAIEKINNLNNSDKENKTAIGIGGPHYCPNFNKIQLNSQYAISHIIPQYVFPLSEEMLRQAIEKTIEPVKTVLLDWKGCGKSENRQKVIEIIEKSGLEMKRTSEVSRETK